jgi:hypothetical protein
MTVPVTITLVCHATCENLADQLWTLFLLITFVLLFSCFAGNAGLLGDQRKSRYRRSIYVGHVTNRRFQQDRPKRDLLSML